MKIYPENPNAPKTPIISQINGRVHTKNILPKHRIQSRFRPVLRQKRGVQASIINYLFSRMPQKAIECGIFIYCTFRGDGQKRRSSFSSGRSPGRRMPWYPSRGNRQENFFRILINKTIYLSSG